MTIESTTCPTCGSAITHYEGRHCHIGCDYLDEQMQKAATAWEAVDAEKFIEDLRSGELEQLPQIEQLSE